MSRNFEMIQKAEQSRTLFQSSVEAPPPLPTPPTQVAVAEPAQPEPRDDETTKQRNIRASQSTSQNGHVLDTAKVLHGNGTAPRSSWLRTAVKFLGIQSGGETDEGPRSLDLKSMALQEGIKLVERIFLSPDSGSNRVILFSGVDDADGGARVCAQAAQTLAAQTHGAVCVLDADLYSRSLQRQFLVKNGAGLSEAMLQSGPVRNYARPLAPGNLWIITCGGEAINPQVPLNSDRMRVRFDELRRQFDYILINAPSISTTAQLTQFGQLSDGVIFVVKANSTRRGTTKQLKESLEELRVRVLGVVLNDRTFPIPDSVYRKL
jgi:Mrp family chromosome partitioning ATPase